jgi:hypothetical protein
MRDGGEEADDKDGGGEKKIHFFEKEKAKIAEMGRGALA